MTLKFPTSFDALSPMAGFGQEFLLTLLTDDPELACWADQCGTDRVGLDLEQLGKKERQAGLDSRLSGHSIESLPLLQRALKNARLFARLNPMHRGTAAEVETACRFGVKDIMLPYFTRPGEVEQFVRIVDERCNVILLLETGAAAVRIDDIVRVGGFSEIMIGLNDLRLSMGLNSHFELIVSPFIEMLSDRIRHAGYRFTMGGVTRPDDTDVPISSDLVLAQYPRLQATGAWLSRSLMQSVHSSDQLAAAISAIRARLDEQAQQSPTQLSLARANLADQLRALKESKPH